MRPASIPRTSPPGFPGWFGSPRASSPPRLARSSVFVLTALLSLGTYAARADSRADAPDPEHCLVSPCDQLGGVVLLPDTTVPSPASDVLVEVRNASNAPIVGWDAFCEFGAGTLCASAVLTGTTNAPGQVRFRFAGGGCVAQETAVRIVVTDGFENWTIRSYDSVKSPDFDGAGSTLAVDHSDLIIFSPAFVAAVACP